MTADEWIEGLRKVVAETIRVDVSGAMFRAHWVPEDVGSHMAMVVVTMRSLSTGKKWSQDFMVSGDAMAHLAVPQSPAGWLTSRHGARDGPQGAVPLAAQLGAQRCHGCLATRTLGLQEVRPSTNAHGAARY